MGPTFATRQNLDLIEEMYGRWKAEPGGVEPTWQAFFEGFELGGSAPTATGSTAQTNVVRMIYAYRDFGHYQAHLDPLSPPPPPEPRLDLSRFGFTDADLGKPFDTSNFVSLPPRSTLRELVAALQETYCRTVAVETSHITAPKVRRWLRHKMESCRNRPNYDRARKLEILKGLHQASAFEKFLQNTFVGQKRFSLEGGDALIPMMHTLIEAGAKRGVDEVVIGMAHRGRLNVLSNVLHKPYQEIINEFEDNYAPGTFNGDGDVKYHLGFSSDYPTEVGESVHVSLSPNPSHLEAVNPVVIGRVRAKQFRFNDAERSRGVPILIHGDAAVAGQGVVSEALNMAKLQGYDVGGTIHLVVNNQVGFTTLPSDARSTRYCTDIFKMAQAPIFHVNGEDPEACAFVCELAMEFRQEFKNDVAIDLYCYRKYGHNEGDEPSFTQPGMYKQIRPRRTPGELYAETLIARNEASADEAKQIEDDDFRILQQARAEAKVKPKKRGMTAFTNFWGKLQPHYRHEPVETGVKRETLDTIAKHLAKVPEGFTVHPKLVPQVEARAKVVSADNAIDWGTAEALAFGSLLLEGTPVRITGQDTRRGTFSHRHAVYTDSETDKRYVPLATLRDGDQNLFEIYDSSLSEVAVLGFEYGFSTDMPEALVLWEAQFGDFVNGAQVIIDQFIAAGESKWQRSNGVVLLLPHGYEGQGPEHSSARLERFLQLCAEDNMQVCNFTTPGQYFHALRRQVKRDFRKPLVVMTPKSLLRSKSAVSKTIDLAEGRFREVLDDANADPAKVKRVILCSGKVYYDLLEKRDARNAADVALVRLEQLYPWPEKMLAEVLARYKSAKNWVWCQEESQNNGAWFFVEPRLRQTGREFVYVGRDASASPAVGSLKIHQKEQNELVEAALSQPKAYVVQASPNAPPASEPQKA